MTKVLILLLLLANSLAQVHAAEADVRYKDHTYYLQASFEVEATPQRIMQIFTDFDNIQELNPAITESSIESTTGEHQWRVRTVVSDCILFFCKDITRVEDTTQYGDTKLESEIIPLLSDLKSGTSVWELKEQGSTTVVDFNANMQPKFWIPPIIRSYVLTKKFKQRVEESIVLLQQKARE